MNCRDINHLLDTDTPDQLTRAQAEAINSHLESCHACKEELANRDDIAALSIPPTPTSLMARVTAALPANEPIAARRSLRPFVIGGVLVAGAVAAAVSFQLSRTGREAALTPVGAAQPVEHIDERAEAATSEPAPVAPGELPEEAGATAITNKAANAALDPRTIAVLKRPEAAADAQAIAVAEQCHDAIVNQLRVVPGVKLIMGAAATEAAFPYPLPSSDQEIGRRLGAGHVLTVSTENGCRVTLYDTKTGMPAGGGMNGQRLPSPDGWNSFSIAMVRSMRTGGLSDPAAASAEFRATLLDSQRSEMDQAQALSEIASAGHRQGRDAIRSAFDKETVTAAIHLGTKSSNADVRGSAWASLRGVNDPQLVQPLLQSLAKDPEAEVRYQAAYTLHALLDQPGVRAGLQLAAAEDPDSEPTVVCCIETVREAAERASIADKDFRGWVRSKLVDERLPARSRLFALGSGTSDGRLVYSLDDVGEDAAGIVFDIGRRERNPQVRQMAWDALGRAKPDEAFLQVLLADMTGHTDEHVRASAAKVLRNYVSNPDVRAALERALNDSSMEVRRAASGALAGDAVR